MEELGEIEAANLKILSRGQTKTDKVENETTIASVHEKIADRAKTDKIDTLGIELAAEAKILSRTRAGNLVCRMMLVLSLSRQIQGYHQERKQIDQQLQRFHTQH